MDNEEESLRESVLEKVVPLLRERLLIVEILEKYYGFKDLRLVGLEVPSSLDRGLFQIVYRAKICDASYFPNFGRRFISEVLINGEKLEKAQFIEGDRLQLYVSFANLPRTQLYINVFR